MNNSKWYESYISCWRNEEPSQFPRALANTLPIEPGITRLLDIGCGSGIIGIYSLLEKKACSVTFADKERIWLDVTRCNVDIKMRDGMIQSTQVRFLAPTDLSKITYEEVAQHDLIAFNPPQLPYAFLDEAARVEIDHDNIERTFRKGGQTGLEVAQHFLGWYASIPKPKPDAVVLLSSFLGRRSITQAISSSGLRLRGEPIATEAVLREFLGAKAEEFLQSPEEMNDRSIRKVGGKWYKTLLTYRLAGS